MLAERLGLDMGLTYQWLEDAQQELVECPECARFRQACVVGLCRMCCSRLLCECWRQEEDPEMDDQVKVVEHFSKVSWSADTNVWTHSGNVALRRLAGRV